MADVKGEWNEYWGGLGSEHKLIGRFFSWYRKNIIAREINYYLNKYQPYPVIPDPVFL